MERHLENWNNITELEFRAYQIVQEKGNWNMITEADNARKAAGLDVTVYWSIIKNYNNLLQKFGHLC